MLREKTDFFIQRKKKKIVDSSHANKFNFNLYKNVTCNERLCGGLNLQAATNSFPECANEKKNLFDRRL